MLRLREFPRKRSAIRHSAALAAAAATALAAGGASAEGPRPWEIALRPAATPVMQRLEAFNDELLVIIFLIATFVLVLLIYVILRFNHRRNPVPSHTEHHPLLEIVWTVVPVLILVIIAVPSFKLMYYMDDVKNPQMIIKVTGHQWYWSYNYPNEGNLSFDSILVPDAKLKPGQPALLTVNHPLVVPVDTTIRVLVTSTDVMHSWFMPSFGVQEYAVPGRINHAWFSVLHPGTYYGECNQICGVNHSKMPIEVKVLSKPDFKRWLAHAKKEFAASGTDGASVRVAANGN
jgi:cytochrome c oxidase subunit II